MGSEKCTLTIGGLTYSANLEDEVYTVGNIPYAKLPMTREGNMNIFAPPLPIEDQALNSPANLDRPAPICLQNKTYGGFEQSAQCQYFNIWLPKAVWEARQDNKVPVLFYIHGGAFMNGSNMNKEFNGANLAQALQIIVVTPSYRIGPLGFLDFSFLDTSCTGNNAFRDLILALQWVQDHIADWGGCKDNVTIMGESAGGTIVSIFPYIKQARGLFHKMIIFSGTPATFIDKKFSIKRAKNFADFTSLHRLEDFCKQENWPQIASSIKPYFMATKLGASAYLPAIDGELIDGNPIQLSQELSKQQQTLPYPIWINSCENELSIMTEFPLYGDLAWGLSDVFEVGNAKEDPAWLDTMKHLYLEHYPATKAESQSYSDSLINASLLWYAEAVAASQKVYFTRLDWESPQQKISNLGSFHASDLYLLFDSQEGMIGTIFFKSILNSDSQKITHRMRLDLQNFLNQGQILNLDFTAPLSPFDPEQGLIKAYDDDVCLKKYMPREIQEVWKQSHYYQSLIQGTGAIE